MRGKPYSIIEMDPRTLKADELPFWVSVEKTGEVVPRADLLVITGTTLLFHSLEAILACAKPGAKVVLVGPTASMLPDAFFRRGVSVMGGDLVTRPDGSWTFFAKAAPGITSLENPQTGWQYEEQSRHREKLPGKQKDAIKVRNMAKKRIN